MMIVFHADLDNTIIYSYKYNIGGEKYNVETYNGREVSYMTIATYRLLKRLSDEVVIVPTSTRSVEQYERIDLKIEQPNYALVCNGGILLVQGRRYEPWYADSLALIADSNEEMLRAKALLDSESTRYFALRYIEELFLFTKCTEPEAVVKRLTHALNMDLVSVLNHGEKIYVIPKSLHKGNALKRFRAYVGADYVMAAGDSAFDISMLKEADLGFAPFGFKSKYGVDFPVMEAGSDELFSEFALSQCLHAANAVAQECK